MSEVKLVITCKAHELADTLKQIANNWGEAQADHRKLAVVPEVEWEEDTFPTDDTPPEVEETELESQDRNQLKAKLDEMGVEYNPRSPTKNLAALLGESLLARKNAKEEVPSEKAPDETYTKEEVRKALVSYVNEVDAVGKEDGQTKARGILKEIGGVDRLGKLDPEHYPVVMAKIQGPQ